MDPRSPARRPRRGLQVLVALLVLLGAGLLVLGVSLRPRTFDIGPNSSMFPAIEPGDWIVVARGPIERGAVVVIQDPRGAGHPPLVKRVVAVGGDIVEIRGGRLVLNGAAVPGEPAGTARLWGQGASGDWQEYPCSLQTETVGRATYRIACTPGQPCGEDASPQQVPPGSVYLLGDRRDHSQDSRAFGPRPEETVLGRVRWVYFSLGPEGVRWRRIGTPVR